MKLDPYLTPHTHKNNSKQIKDLNVKPKTIKPLEEGIRRTIHNNGLGNYFLDLTPNAQGTKKKKRRIDKMDLM